MRILSHCSTGPAKVLIRNIQTLTRSAHTSARAHRNPDNSSIIKPRSDGGYFLPNGGSNNSTPKGIIPYQRFGQGGSNPNILPQNMLKYKIAAPQDKAKCPVDSKLNFQITADPLSVSVLPGLKEDKRAIKNLINGQTNNDEDQNLWLCPFINSKLNNCSYNLNREINQIFLFFDKLTTISAINIWNYTKTFTRGVRDIEIYLDERMIFKVPQIPLKNS